MAADSSHASASIENPFQLFVDYPFSSDETYQQGLASILSNTSPAWHEKSEEEKDDLLRRSRIFYFNRVTGYSLTVENTLEYEQSLRARLSPTSDQPPLPLPPTLASVPPEPLHAEPPILTFAEIKALIEQGKIDQIPNNRTIPDGLNDAPSSESITPAKKKPWEMG